MENYDIALILRKKREVLGYSRAKVCELCGNAFTEKTLYRMETGKAKMSRHTIKELLAIYHQPSYTICAAMDMEQYSMNRMYNEVFELMLQRNFIEAKRKLELFESYINTENESSIHFFEVLKAELYCFINKEVTEYNKVIVYLEELFVKILPKEVDLEKWPLVDAELNMYLMYCNILTLQKKDKRILLLRKLIQNIEHRYHGVELFTDYHGLFTHQLIGALKDTKENNEIILLAEKSLDICSANGDISNTYRIKNTVIQYMEDYNFFHNQEIKEKCMQQLKKSYYLSLSCNDISYSSLIKKRLIEVYNVDVLF